MLRRRMTDRKSPLRAKAYRVGYFRWAIMPGVLADARKIEREG